MDHTQLEERLFIDSQTSGVAENLPGVVPSRCSRFGYWGFIHLIFVTDPNRINRGIFKGICPFGVTTRFQTVIFSLVFGESSCSIFDGLGIGGGGRCMAKPVHIYAQRIGCCSELVVVP